LGGMRARFGPCENFPVLVEDGDGDIQGAQQLSEGSAGG